jgi:predicted ribosomally synthesized peptide with SipW-like signal peptide
MSRFRRLHIIFAALACLTLSAGAYAVWTEYATFPPYFRGFGEVTRRGEVAGWAVGPASGGARVEVQLYVDGRFVAHGVASLPRPDVVAAGRAEDENCGYSFALPALPAGTHEARVYALHAPGRGGGLRTLTQLGNPLHFTTDDVGRVTAQAR